MSSQTWKMGLAAVPLAVWFRDSILGVSKVQGSSMEPTLRHGDWVLVRKADWGFLLEALYYAFREDNHDTERARVQRIEQHGVLPKYQSRLYEHPPVLLPGDVVVYKSPEEMHELCIKRVVAVGGQWLRRPKTPPLSVEPYSLHVWGDNPSNSRDSRQLGPLSKNLVTGIVEYVIWPPSRIGPVERKQIGKATWM